MAPNLELEGIPPDEAFTILGNEIRLAIIRVLWAADAAHRFDDGSDSAVTMAYTELRREVEVDDNGKFNYHLSELLPHFVRKTEGGYRLSGAGKQIARTIIAVTESETLDFSAELDEACPFCRSKLRASYEDQWLRIRCPECDGLFGDQAPKGTLFLTQYPAAGMTARDPDQTISSALYRCALDIAFMMHGVCRECSGSIESSMSVCESHNPADHYVCDDCMTPFPVWADMRCSTCGFAKRLPVEMYVMGLIAVGSFFDAEEVDNIASSLSRAIKVLTNRVTTDVSTDPIRVTVSVALDTTEFVVTLDGEMTVVDRHRLTPTGAQS